MEAFIGKNKFLDLLFDGAVISVSGFLGVGAPEKLIDAILESEKKDFTIICNDTAFDNKGVGRLVSNNRVKKVITSHIGTNKSSGKLMLEGLMEVELVPQGTLLERLRAKGAGLGGILTPTGVGTAVEEGKKKMEIDGKEYILELPLGADFSLIHAHTADKKGNLVYRNTARNFNPVMALSGNIVIADTENIVETGSIDPNQVMTPGILVNYIYNG